MRSLLVDFLNHGILPFVGRSVEIDRIMAFWDGTDGASGLRAALVRGEAGIGKSRLIEELAPRITQAGGAVLHVKLYPDSPSTLPPLISGALHSFIARRNPLQEDVSSIWTPIDGFSSQEAMASIITSLRRVVRLRPTLLIIEDLHLLEGQAVNDLSMLLETLADEFFSVLCVARPVQVAARGVLERYLVMNMQLQGLDRPQLESMWSELFEHPPCAGTLDAMLRVTLGSPLALRSAIRGAIQAGVLVHDRHQNRWKTTLPPAAFAHILERNVNLLSEGMAAHLDAEEFDAACKLAVLGEVFARETARLLLPGNEEIIDALAFKGIIAGATITPPPLPNRPGAATATPLAFTHTLLHRQFVESARIVPVDLMEVIRPYHPLYSTLPFLLFADALPDAREHRAALTETLDHTLAVACTHHQAGNNQMTLQLLDAADRIFDHIQTLLDHDRAARLQVRLLRTRLTCMRITDDPDTYHALALQLLELANPELMPRCHLMALIFLYMMRRRGDEMVCHETLQRIDAHIQRHPELFGSNELITVLERLAGNAVALVDLDVLLKVEQWLQSLLQSPFATEELRRTARFKVFPFLLLSYRTPEEIARREEFVREIDTVAPDPTGNLQMMKLSFLTSLGRFTEALECIEQFLPFFEKAGHWGWVSSCHRFRLCIRMAFGVGMEQTLEEARRLCGSSQIGSPEHFRDITGAYLLEFGLMRNEVAWAWNTAREFSRDHRYFSVETQVIAALAGLHDLAEIPESEIDASPLRNLLTLAMARSPQPEACEAAYTTALSLLRTPLLHVDDLLTLRATIDLIIAVRSHWSDIAMQEALDGAIHDALMQTLEYLGLNALFTFMGPLLESYGSWLSTAERTYWQVRIERMAGKHRIPDEPARQRQALQISMLGTIHAQWDDDEVIQFRGARLRALLGVLVADGMLDQRLSDREFSYIVTDIPEESERSRKMLNGVVHRLREVLGHDAILTGDGNPKLNPDLVRVDLIDARNHLRQAAEALRNRSLLRARVSLLEALRISNGNVPFPTLYEDFFEALRADFEHELRTSVIRISRQLLVEGDSESACEILGHGCRVIPDDEELSELLCETLVATGKRAEAQRVRMRALVAA
jgi:DNA-binding SARP family transcriptional activator